MTYLLDVNAVIALIDPYHVFHNAAHTWLSSLALDSWATCPITENGAFRIVGHTGYPNVGGNLVAVSWAISDLRNLTGHVFWPDDISILDPSLINVSRLTTSGHVTDSYLLALAVAKGGKLATFDRRLITNAVFNSENSLYLIQ